VPSTATATRSTSHAPGPKLPRRTRAKYSRRTVRPRAGGRRRPALRTGIPRLVPMASQSVRTTDRSRGCRRIRHRLIRRLRQRAFTRDQSPPSPRNPRLKPRVRVRSPGGRADSEGRRDKDVRSAQPHLFVSSTRAATPRPARSLLTSRSRPEPGPLITKHCRITTGRRRPVQSEAKHLTRGHQIKPRATTARGCSKPWIGEFEAAEVCGLSGGLTAGHRNIR
jgi:hypothetical protein